MRPAASPRERARRRHHVEADGDDHREQRAEEEGLQHHVPLGPRPVRQRARDPQTREPPDRAREQQREEAAANAEQPARDQGHGERGGDEEDSPNDDCQCGSQRDLRGSAAPDAGTGVRDSHLVMGVMFSQCSISCSRRRESRNGSCRDPASGSAPCTAVSSRARSRSRRRRRVASGATFYAVVQPDDLRWHVPSHRYDPDVLRLRCRRSSTHVDIVISVHGFGGLRDADDRWTTALLGGANREFARRPRSRADQRAARLPLDQRSRIDSRGICAACIRTTPSIVSPTAACSSSCRRACGGRRPTSTRWSGACSSGSRCATSL